jgi:hypothetical protein
MKPYLDAIFPRHNLELEGSTEKYHTIQYNNLAGENNNVQVFY